ncbi:hypothetical protein GGR56DRAFT_655594 [Xylariaceae sp. FL0804]|nr:hypothetical protein GGR56DRAFT_655594 [Xylariaceae sp. FL0804]
MRRLSWRSTQSSFPILIFPRSMAWLFCRICRDPRDSRSSGPGFGSGFLGSSPFFTLSAHPMAFPTISHCGSQISPSSTTWRAAPSRSPSDTMPESARQWGTGVGTGRSFSLERRNKSRSRMFGRPFARWSSASETRPRIRP